MAGKKKVADVEVPTNFDSLYTVLPIHVVLDSITALLQNRMTPETQDAIREGSRKQGGYTATPREEAESVVYRDESGGLYVVGEAIRKMIQERGRWHTVSGAKGKNVSHLIPGGISVPERLPLHCPKLVGASWDMASWKRCDNFEVDIRTVVNPATGRRNVRCRPRIDKWRLDFELHITPYLLDPETVRMLLMEGGIFTGIGDFRPQKSGQYGKFVVSLWQPGQARSMLPNAAK